MSFEAELAEIDLAAAREKLEFLERRRERAVRIQKSNDNCFNANDMDGFEQAVRQQAFEVKRCELKVRLSQET